MGMDGLPHNDTGDSSHAGLATVPKADPALDVETVHARLAWPVAERMLQTLASNKAPRELRAADFVKESFAATFTDEVTSWAESLKNGHSGEGDRMRGSSIVDAALGAMGYGATAIYDRKISTLVEMLTSLVQRKMSCDFHSQSSPYFRGPCQGETTSRGEEVLNGSLCELRISTNVLLQILETCTPFLFSGTANSKQVLAVVDALMTVAINTSFFTPYAAALQIRYRKMVYANEDQGERCPSRVIQSFVDYVLAEKDFTYLRLQPCSRLRIWRLHPLCLKEDLSRLASEAMERLLLPLDKELCEREEWATLVVCLALAPDLFVEARRLLHSWFLLSGAMRLWELRAYLVSAVWKVLNCSSVRGVTAGASFPPQHAFYHTSLRPYLVILRFAPSSNGLVKLVSLLDHMENLNRSSVGSSSADPPAAFANKKEDGEGLLYDSSLVNHNSIWALLMDFLPWLHFAFRVLFRWGSSQQNATSKSTERMSEMATLEGLEGAAFNIDGGGGQASPRVAAKYIARVLNPIDTNLRELEEKMLLQCSNSWDKVMETVRGDTNPGVPLGDDLHLRQCGEQSMKRGRCGLSVCRMKRRKCDETNGTCGKQSDEIAGCWQSFSLAALDLWLTQLPRKLCTVKHGIQLEGLRFVDKEDKIEDKKICYSDEQIAPVSQPHIDYKQDLCTTTFLVLGALTESLPMCSPCVMCHLLQFVGRGSIYGLSDERNGQETGPEVPHYNSLCSNFHSSDCFLQAEPKGTECQADGSLGNYSAHEKQRSADWISGSAALFNFLDSIDDGLFPGTALSESDFKVAMSKLQENLAVIMSGLVSEWGSTFEIHLSLRVFPKGPSTERYVVNLEDLRQRFGTWIGKLQLSTEVERTCDNARKELDVRIANLRSILIAS